MFCAKCGTQLPEGANVCPSCGEKVEKEINFSDVTNYAGQKAQQVSDNVQNQVQNIRQTQAEEKAGRAVRDIREMFVSAEEQQRAVIGGGYLSNMLQTGVLGRGFGVLTNRRLYYRGKCFYKVGGRYVKTDEDCTVDLQDITSSGFTYTRYVWLLVSAVMVLAFGIYDLSVESASRYPEYALGIAVCLIGAALLAAYVYFKMTMYTVTFAGGSLSIKASSFGVREVKSFEKALHQAKDGHPAGMR